MSVQRCDGHEVAARAVAVLGLNDTVVDLFSEEGICASLRRAASFLCPASPRQLVDAVLDALRPLKPDIEREDLMQALDNLVSVGDLLELRPTGGRTRLLFLGPPSYVEMRPGHFLLLGIRPNAGQILSEESLGAVVAYESHTRSVVLHSNEGIEALAAMGLHRLRPEQWAQAPRQDASSSVVEMARRQLISSRTPGNVSDLELIDPTTSVRYYKGRWREPKPTDQGIFIGRRPQAYGAPLWCAIEIAEGVPQSVLDFPVDSPTAPGWDEARRLQAAIDAERGSPQVCRVRADDQSSGTRIFDFFVPLPSWAIRYLNLIGVPVPKAPGSLFSYRVPDGVDSKVREFLSKSLWMTVTEEVQGR